MNSNPYESVAESGLVVERVAPSAVRWAVIGFSLICMPLVLMGGYGLYVDYQYAAALPPGAAHCGNAALGAIFLIFPGAPMFGCVGAAIGYVAAKVVGSESRDAGVRGDGASLDKGDTRSVV